MRFKNKLGTLHNAFINRKKNISNIFKFYFVHGITYWLLGTKLATKGQWLTGSGSFL